MCVSVMKEEKRIVLEKVKQDGVVETLEIGPYSQPKVLSALQYLGCLAGGGVVRVNDYTIRTCRSKNYFSVKHPKNGVVFIPRQDVGATITSIAKLI